MSRDSCSSPAGPQSSLSTEAENAQGYERRSSSPSCLLLLKFSPTPQNHAKLLQLLESGAASAGAHTQERNPALPQSKSLTEAHPALSRQPGRTGIRSNNCCYYRQEGHTMAKRKQSNDSSKVSYTFPAERDLPAALKSLSQTHSSKQIQT